MKIRKFKLISLINIIFRTILIQLISIGQSCIWSEQSLYVFQTGGVDGGAAESAREAGGSDDVRRA